MAHQIESMFFMGETPWHGLGNRVTEALTVEQAIKQAGLDWAVRKEEIQLKIAPDLYVPGFATVREINNKIDVLGVVGPRYTPLQNTEAFNFFNPLVESGLVTLETAGALCDGKKIWVMARINDNSDMAIVGDDMVRKFILLSNSHDGTTAVRCGFTPVRVVCANTLAMAHSNGESQLIRLRHSKSIVANLESLREVMNVANANFEATADQFRQLARKQISRVDLERYVKICLEVNPDAKADDISTRKANQIADVISLFESGRGMDMKGVKGTVWAAYNAVTEYLTHNAGNNADSRYNSLWFGNGAVRNQVALTAAIALAA